ncbi:MAG: tetratricopeptide repeat protein [Salibacteraceae bacterium]
MLLTKEANDSLRYGMALNFVGVSWILKNRLDSAQFYLNRAERQFVSIKDWNGQVLSLGNLSIVQMRRHAPGESLKILLRQIEAIEKLNDSTRLFHAYAQLGTTYRQLDRHEEALELYDKCLQYYLAKQDSAFLQMIYHNMAVVYSIYEQLPMAEDYFLRALEMARKQRNVKSEYGILEQLAGIMLRSCRFEEADSCINASLQVMRENGMGVREGEILITQSKIKLKLGGWEESLELLQQAEKKHNAIGSVKARLNVMLAKWTVFQALNWKDSAEVYIQPVLDLVAQIENPLETNIYIREIYQYYEWAEQPARAFVYFKRYKEIEDSLFSRNNYAYLESMRADANAKELALVSEQRKVQARELELEKSRSERQQLLFVSSVLLALALLIGFLWWRSRLKEQTNLQLLHEKQKGLRAVLGKESEVRRSIARDLHDGLGQLLTNLSFLVGDLKQKAPRFELAGTLEKMETMIELAHQESRSIAHQIRPHALEEKGLEGALREMFVKHCVNHDLTVDFQCDGKEKIPAEVQIELFRMCQEMLTNTLKQARATTFHLYLQFHTDRVLIVARDNGIGFDWSKVSGKGEGLLNLKHRTEAMGGVFHQERSKPSGQAMRIRIPIKGTAS